MQIRRAVVGWLDKQIAKIGDIDLIGRFAAGIESGKGEVSSLPLASKTRAPRQPLQHHVEGSREVSCGVSTTRPR